MKKLYIYLATVIMLVSCHKQDKPNPTNPGGTDGSVKPKTISIKYYQAGKLQISYTFVPDYTAPANKVITVIKDTTPSINGMTNFKEIRHTISYNAQDGSMDSVNSVVYKAGTVFRNQTTDSIYSITYGESTYANFFADTHATTVAPGVFNLDFKLTSFSDSMHTVQVGYNACNIQYGIGNNQFGSILSLSGDPRIDLTHSNSDSIYLRDVYTNSGSFLPLRYFNYYYYDIPWYKPQTNNESVYFIHAHSVYTCDSLVLKNGSYVLVPDGPDNYISVFTPAIKRKLSYAFNSDTTLLKNIIDIINPITRDPMWYYVSFCQDWFLATRYKEQGDYYAIYDWTSEKYSDSVFTYNSDKTLLFKQAAIVTNTVVKDTQGRIIKVTNQNSSYPFNKVMDITY